MGPATNQSQGIYGAGSPRAAYGPKSRVIGRIQFFYDLPQSDGGEVLASAVN